MGTSPLVNPPNASIGFTKDSAGAPHALTGTALHFLTNITNALNGTKTGAVSTVTLGNGSKWSSGAGGPNGVVAGNLGDFYSNTDGGEGNTFFVKESGGPGSKTGWVSK